MKQRFAHIKNKRKIKAFNPINYRIDLYVHPLANVDNKFFDDIDLGNITLLDYEDDINPTLFDETITEEVVGNIYALMEEGVLKNQPTGADLGIYNYKSVEEIEVKENKFDYFKPINRNYKPEKISDVELNLNEVVFQQEQDYKFSHCVLAEENPIGGADTQVIVTFRGYLEVTTKDFSILRKANFERGTLNLVFVPQYFIHKYRLRNGDEIVGACKTLDGKTVLSSILTINQTPYYAWNIERPWFNQLKTNTKLKSIKGKGDYIEQICQQFKLLVSDNVFMYINENSSNTKVTPKFVAELSKSFDKVVYINPEYNTNIKLIDYENIIKFCTYFNETLNNQISITLLGINYAKRMLELGKNVAIIIDNISMLPILDCKNMDEMPVTKTFYGCIKATHNGSTTSFSIIDMKSREDDRFIYNRIRRLETLGIVIDNNEIDLYSSYRV